MFHNGHELDNVVAQILNAGQDVSRELLVRPHASLGGRYANVRLVYAHIIGLGRSRVLELVLLGLGRVPEARLVNGGDVEVLRDALDPGWDTLNALPMGKNQRDLRMTSVCGQRPSGRAAHLELRVVGDGADAVLRGNCNLPDAIVVLLHGVTDAVPVVYSKVSSRERGYARALTELPDEVRLRRVGRPLAVHHVPVLPHIEPKLVEALRETLVAAFVLVYSVLPLPV